MKIIYEDFNNSNIYNLHKLFLSGSEAEEVKNKYTKGGVGYGELKKLLVQSIISYIEPMRTKRESLEKNLNEILERNSNFFDDEVEKLDKWADDMKKSLELDLKKLDIDIKTAKTNAKKLLILKEKITAQREIKDMEKKRNAMRQKLYQSQDEVGIKKDSLLERVETQLKQKTELKNIFCIKFKII